MKYFILLSCCFFAFNAHAFTIDDVHEITTRIDDAVPSDLKERTSGLKKRTVDTLAGVEDIAQGFRASLLVMSGQVKDGVRNGIEDADVILRNNREGLGDFLGVVLPNPDLELPSIAAVDLTPPDRNLECIFGTPCYQFRQDLKVLLERIRDSSNAIISINGNANVSMAINLEEFIDLVDWVPSRALYPLYKALKSGGAEFFEGLPVLLDQLVVDFDTLSPIALSEVIGSVDAANNENFPYVLYDSKDCQLIVDNYTTVVRAKEGMAATAQVLKILGKTFIAGGKTVAKAPKLAAGFTEFLGLQLELDGNLQDSFGNILDGLADSISSKSDSYADMIDSCARLRAQLNILDNQQLILSKMDDIETSIADAGGSNTVAASGSSSGGAGALAINLFLCALLLVGLYRQYASSRPGP